MRRSNITKEGNAGCPDGDCQELNTLPKLLYDAYQKFGDSKVAIREKEYGIWNEYSWKDYYEKVKYLALGLISIGVKQGDKICIFSDNKPEWIYMELAAMALKAIPMGVYADSSPDQIYYAVVSSDAQYVMVGDQEQTDKLLENGNKISLVRCIIVEDIKGLKNYRDQRLIKFTDLIQRGYMIEKELPPGVIEESIQTGEEHDLAFFALTSGTTATPKITMLSHKNLIAMIKNLNEIESFSENDQVLSFLPLPWMGEQMMSVSLCLFAKACVNFPENVNTIQQNLVNVQPTVMFAPPHFWEKICSEVQIRVMNATWFKRQLFNKVLNLGMLLAKKEIEGTNKGIFPQLWNYLCYLLGFRAVRKKYGLLCLRKVYTGGAPLGPDVFQFTRAIGAKIKQIYGQTEVSGISVVHRDDDIKLETVGKSLPGMEVKISERGEILTRGDTLFVGYYKDPEATATAKMGGWLHSGDYGLLDEDGHLIMIDREKDVLELEGGVKFSPQLIENKLKFSPFIRETVIIGKDRPYISALIQIDLENTGKWAEKHLIPYTTFKDLSQKKEVKALIQKEVERVNAQLPEKAKIKGYLLLDKELDADDEELTRTQKVRRSIIYEKYRYVIDAQLYAKPSSENFSLIDNGRLATHEP